MKSKDLDLLEADIMAELRRVKSDADRWRYVRDNGLVWLEPPFDGCTAGRVGDEFATRYVDHRMQKR